MPTIWLVRCLISLGVISLLLGCGGPSSSDDPGEDDGSETGDYVPPTPECDPLYQDCPPDHGCYFVGGDQGFACEIPGESAGAYGAACQFPANCEPGLTCSSLEVVPGCSNGFGCCTPFCELGSNDCPAGLACEKLYESGAPPGFEGIGVCTPSG